MTIRMRATWWAVLGLLAATAQAAPPAAVAPPEGVTFTELERAEGLAIAGHPNELWRVRALRALKLGQVDRAKAAAADARRALAGDSDKVRRIDEMMKALGLEG